MPSESAEQSTKPGAKGRTPRAVTATQKSERRQTILSAAETHLRAAGFERFSMETLARDLGVARGTLYRYFATREELLFYLYDQQRTRFMQNLHAELHQGISDEAFLRSWFEHSIADPLFLALRARLESVIEHNIPMDHLADTKLRMYAEFVAHTEYLSTCLNLPPATVRKLVVGLTALMLGAAQADAAPAGLKEVLPEEMSTLIDQFTSEGVFQDNALLILQGLRNSAQ